MNLYEDLKNQYLKYEKSQGLTRFWLADRFMDYMNLNIEDSLNDVGVYMIDDFYIGKSNNIFGRVLYHILEIFENDNEKSKRIIDKLSKNEKLNINQISKNKNEEAKLIKEYSQKYDLVNIDHNPNRKRINKNQ